MQNSLCWYCKRITDENYVCPWVDDGVAVKGWNIEDVHDIDSDHIRNGVAKTCTVISCPLFIEGNKSICFLEFLKNASVELDIPRWKINRDPDKFVELYEKKIGKLPDWVTEEMNNIHKNVHKK